MKFSDPELTRDAFLGGRLSLLQPRDGYRAGVDPVLLAAAIPARTGQTVLDLGCGAGTAALCLHARVPGLHLTGVERQPAYGDLARRNGAAAGADFHVETADIAALPPDLRQRQFDHVVANPPYFDRSGRTSARDEGRESGRSEDIPLARWLDVAAQRLAPRGYLHVIQRIERLPDLLAGCADRVGSIEVLPLVARIGRAPHLVILRARKGGRAKFCLHAPVVMHAGARHERDGDSYAPEISAVLRDAAALPWPSRGR